MGLRPRDVQMCIRDRPMSESGPYCAIKSPATASAPEPLTGLSSISAPVSAGMPSRLSAGEMSEVNASSTPLARSI